MSLAAIQQQAAAIAEVSDNFNESVAGGGSRLLPEGYCLARLVSYIEFGKQPQEFNGQKKDPALEFRLGFALFGEGYANEDGTPYLLETYGITESRNSKAGAFLLFKALNWKNQATCFPQLLGEAYLVKIKTHTPKAEGAKPRSVIDLKGFLPPLDALSKAPYQVPAAPDSMYRLFSWKLPTLAAWHALKIEGTWDDGKSKNWIQETILGATDFAGSALESLLLQNNVAFTVPTKAPAAAAPAAPAAPEVAAQAPLAQPAAPVAAPAIAAVPVAAPSLITQPVTPQAVSAPIPVGIAPTNVPSPQVNSSTTSPSEAAAPAVAAVPPVVLPTLPQ